jgi:hypothetical protein
LMPGAGAAHYLRMATAKTQSEHDAILNTVHLYIDTVASRATAN